VTEGLLLKECVASEYGVPNASQCLPCPFGLAACIGGPTTRCFTCNGSTSLNVTEGYWRYSASALKAYHCSTGGVCMGGTELGTCGERYVNHAPLCAVCTDEAARDVLGTCVECESKAASVVVMSVFVLGALLVVAIFVVVTLKEDGNEAADHSLVLLLKIMLNFVQVTGMIGEFEVNFPTYVSNYFDVIAAGSGGSGISINPINCLFPWMTFLDKLLIMLVAPFAILFLLALAILWYGWRHRHDDDDDDDDGDEDATDEEKAARAPKPIFNRKVFVTSSIIVNFLAYQTLLSVSIDTFKCQKLETAPGQLPLNVLLKDARVDCYGATYERGVATAMWGLFVYGAALPLGGMIVILRTARNADWFEANGTFSFIIRGFRLRFWFWEFVIVARKVIVRILLSTVSDATLQALLGVWILTACFVLHAYVRPYVRNLLNRAEGMSLLVSLVTLNIGLLLRSVAATGSVQEVCGVPCLVIIVAMLSANVVLLVYYAYFIAQAAFERAVEMFGIDMPDGTRKFSIRNMYRFIFTTLDKRDKVAPNFQDYKPKFLNRELAVTVLGEDCLIDGSDSDMDENVDEVVASFEMVDFSHGGDRSTHATFGLATADVDTAKDTPVDAVARGYESLFFTVDDDSADDHPHSDDVEDAGAVTAPAFEDVAHEPVTAGEIAEPLERLADVGAAEFAARRVIVLRHADGLLTLRMRFVEETPLEPTAAGAPTLPAMESASEPH